MASLALLTRTAHPFYPRYLVPIAPFAAILVGSLVRDGAEWLASRRVGRPVLLNAGLTVIVLLLVAPQARDSIDYMK